MPGTGPHSRASQPVSRADAEKPYISLRASTRQRSGLTPSPLSPQSLTLWSICIRAQLNIISRLGSCTGLLPELLLLPLQTLVHTHKHIHTHTDPLKTSQISSLLCSKSVNSSQLTVRAQRLNTAHSPPRNISALGTSDFVHLLLCSLGSLCSSLCPSVLSRAWLRTSVLWAFALDLPKLPVDLQLPQTTQSSHSPPLPACGCLFLPAFLSVSERRFHSHSHHRISPNPAPSIRCLPIWALAPQPCSYVFNLFPFFPTSRGRMVQWLSVWLLASGCLSVNTPALLANCAVCLSNKILYALISSSVQWAQL